MQDIRCQIPDSPPTSPLLVIAAAPFVIALMALMFAVAPFVLVYRFVARHLERILWGGMVALLIGWICTGIFSEMLAWSHNTAAVDTAPVK